MGGGIGEVGGRGRGVRGMLGMVVEVEDGMREEVVGVDVVKEEMGIGNKEVVEVKEEEVLEGGDGMECGMCGEEREKKLMGWGGMMKEVREGKGMGVGIER